MKKMLSLLLFFSFPGMIFAQDMHKNSYSKGTQNPQTFAFYAPQLSHAVKILLQVPECRQLLEEIQKEGPIGLKWENLGSHSSDAVWYGDKRLIAVNSSTKHSEGQKICSILFEMHNAVNNKNFIQIDRLAIEKKIDKESYIESIERLEHQNALNTKKLIEKGIAIGAFPSDARWSIIHNFDDHYKVQQLMGHSTQIGYAYDTLNPNGKFTQFTGTIANVKKLSEQDKKKMLNFLALKDHLEFGNSHEKEQARRILHQTYQEIKFKPHSYKGHENSQLVVLNDVFKGNETFEKLRRNYYRS